MGSFFLCQFLFNIKNFLRSFYAISRIACYAEDVNEDREQYVSPVPTCNGTVFSFETEGLLNRE